MSSIRNFIVESLIIAHRNFRTSIDTFFIVVQIGFPIIYILIAGYSYLEYLPKDTAINGIPYIIYLASGMAVFQAFYVPQMMGSLVWEDKKNSMLLQLMVILTRRSSYLAGFLISTLVGVLLSVGLVFILYPPLLSASKFLVNPLLSFGLVLYALMTLTIFFGCISMIISLKVKTTQRLNLLSTGIFMALSFMSSALFPAEQTPFSNTLNTVFYLNPLTYIVDITRTGLFLLPINNLIMIEMIILGLFSLFFLVITIQFLNRMDLSK